MTKIIILVDVLHTLAAGSERQILELSKNIDKNKFKISVFCLKGDDDVLKELNKFNVETLCVDINRIYGLRSIIAGFKFAKHLKKEKIDVLITYHFGSDVWGAFFGKLAGVPVIISNRRDMSYWKKNIHNVFYGVVYRLINKIIVVSKGIRDMIVQTEYPKHEKIKVIYNGIDLGRFSNGAMGVDVRDELGIPQNARILGCTANIKPVKGQRYLIEAMATVHKKYPDIYLLLAGNVHENDNDLKKELNDLVKNLGLTEKVKFLGSRGDVPELLRQFDICVLPTESEGLPNSLLEYMAVKKTNSCN